MARVVLDAGHGGADPGALGADGRTLEKHINWEVAVVVRDGLRKIGHKCDIAPHRDSGKTPLRERVTFARQRKAEYFVSIHCNSAVSSRASGFELFFPLQEKYTESARQFGHRLGACYAKKTGLRPRSRNDGVKPETQALVGRLGVLHGHVSHTMVVLLELAFMSNPKELRLMKTEKFRRRAADSFADVIGKPIKQVT